MKKKDIVAEVLREVQKTVYMPQSLRNAQVIRECGWVKYRYRPEYYFGHKHGDFKLQAEGDTISIFQKDQSNVLHKLVFKGKVNTKEELLLIHDKLGIK